jgi:hypothetical protein
MTYVLPEITASHIDLYLHNADVSAVYQLAAKNGGFTA